MRLLDAEIQSIRILLQRARKLITDGRRIADAGGDKDLSTILTTIETAVAQEGERLDLKRAEQTPGHVGDLATDGLDASASLIP